MVQSHFMDTMQHSAQPVNVARGTGSLNRSLKTPVSSEVRALCRRARGWIYVVGVKLGGYPQGMVRAGGHEGPKSRTSDRDLLALFADVIPNWAESKDIHRGATFCMSQGPYFVRFLFQYRARIAPLGGPKWLRSTCLGYSQTKGRVLDSFFHARHLSMFAPPSRKYGNEA